ncbi:hypothetical protein NBRC10512_007607 [Rhodotorula toruloides]|uniref:Nitrate/nitrite transporter n=2 Tax=Rhodotorula toruloides TaxID=5286 RepID=A0A061AY73_RHOTO|nr:MFS nitrate transporter [Rhodotorula toruloides NP11]EMS20801.1 MFS nitrate transporter [Rhodotorula toruloides NP11]CDR40344.1 RHTO0S05e01970g1_1 [Rhodotorula toruloides]
MSVLEKRASNEIVAASSSDIEERHALGLHHGPPPFRWASLWEPAQINPLNGKSYTLPILRLTDQYSINFHLAWLGFFVAFLSWFAFPPLIPEAIKKDLKLTTAQVGNSNIIALLATLVCRFATGPLVDRFGPRYCMAALLVAGAIPSGLAGTISSAGGLYAVRFFIGILGATFVPCLAWTTAFFDKSIVGTANSFVGGWGNLGGGVTFVVQVATFQSLMNRGLTSHKAWRVCFAVVPVPILLFVATATLVLGTDCPAGKWSARHTLPATAVAARQGHLAHLDASERAVVERKAREKAQGSAHVQPADDEEDALAEIPLDVAVNEPLTFKTFLRMISQPYTWLPTLMYMTTFGFELAVDANIASVLVANNKLTQLEAGYYGSTFGFLNLVTRPFGGYLADRLYARYGLKAKKYVTIVLGVLEGAMSIAFGAYTLTKHNAGVAPSISVQMGVVTLMAIFSEVANGTNFSLAPHCNPFSNGFTTGLVGAFGNLGGIWFALVFRYQVAKGYSNAWIICGAVAVGVNLFCILLPTPKK